MDGVRIVDLDAIDVNLAGDDFHAVARDGDAALDEIGKALIGERGAKHDDLRALRRTRERNVVTGERHASAVADAADQYVVADEDSIFHRAAGDHAGLRNAAFNENEGEHDPEPGDDFCPEARLLSPLRLVRLARRLSCG